MAKKVEIATISLKIGSIIRETMFTTLQFASIFSAILWVFSRIHSFSMPIEAKDMPAAKAMAAASTTASSAADAVIKRLLRERQLFKDYTAIPKSRYLSRGLLKAFADGEPPNARYSVMEGNVYLNGGEGIEGARLLEIQTLHDPVNSNVATVDAVFALDVGDGASNRASVSYSMVYETGRGWRIDDILNMNPPPPAEGGVASNPSLKGFLIDEARALEACRAYPGVVSSNHSIDPCEQRERLEAAKAKK